MFPIKISLEKPKEKEWKSDDLLSSLNRLECRIVGSLHKMACEGFKETANWRTKDWTSKVKEVLANLAKEEGLGNYPRWIDGKDKWLDEWLFDFVWALAPLAKPESGKKDADPYKWQNVQKLVLACECEWTATQDEILQDFLKLTFAYADMRLFIYTHREEYIDVDLGYGDGAIKMRPADLCRQVCPPSRGFRYLLVGIPDEDSDLVIDAWIS